MSSTTSAPNKAYADPVASATDYDSVDKYDSARLKPILEELLRQRETVPGRVANLQTRAAILIGVAGALGGTELVTSSGVFWVSCVSLALYFLAAVAGVVALWPRSGQEVYVKGIMDAKADDTLADVERTVVTSNMEAHAAQINALRFRSFAILLGFIALIVAWASSGAGTAIGLLDTSTSNTVVEIEGDVGVVVK